MEFGNKIVYIQGRPLTADGIDILQVNLGYRCNMSCMHCHIGAGSNRAEAMERHNIERVLGLLKEGNIGVLDITGGAPELNPHLRYLVREARKKGSRVAVRTNLTVFFENGMEDLPEFYADNSVEVIASLPYYTEARVERVRGKGSFQKSIKALQRLNNLGYGYGSSEKRLNLVHNPVETVLAPAQERVEEQYRRELGSTFGIFFDRLYTFTNMPIGRFKEHLVRTNSLDAYREKLASAFNPQTLPGLMCRHLVNVRWDGMFFDCDFNQILGRSLDGGCPQHIRDFDISRLAGRTINVGEHCYGCTAAQGST